MLSYFKYPASSGKERFNHLYEKSVRKGCPGLKKLIFPLFSLFSFLEEFCTKETA